MSGTARYALRRVAQALFVLWAAFTVSFLVMYALPSDPAQLLAGTDNSVSPEQLAALRHEYGLDRPLVIQYLDQLAHVVRGDLGRSLQSGREVTSIIAEAIPPTAQVTGAALLLAVVGGGALALVATGTRRNRVSGVLLGLPPLGVAIPSFWLGLMLLQQFSFTLVVVPGVRQRGLAQRRAAGDHARHRRPGRSSPRSWRRACAPRCASRTSTPPGPRAPARRGCSCATRCATPPCRR